MKGLIFITISVLLVITVGCGKSDSDRTTKENAGKLENLDRDLEEVSGQLDSMKSDMNTRVAAIEKNIEAIKKMLEKKGNGSEALAAGDFPEDFDSEVMSELGDLVDTIDRVSDSLAAILTDIGTLKAEVANIRSGSQNEQRREEMRQAWETMGDKEKFASTLDKFSTEYASKLEESGRKDEFLADMEAYKAQATAEYTPEELRNKYEIELTEAISQTTNERRAEGLQRRLQDLTDLSGEELESRLNDYMRFQNARNLSEITRKYEIPGSEVREYGLVTFGGGRGGRGNRTRGGGGSGR